MEAIERGRSKLTLDAMVDKKLGLENISEQIATVSNRDQWKRDLYSQPKLILTKGSNWFGLLWLLFVFLISYVVLGQNFKSNGSTQQKEITKV